MTWTSSNENVKWFIKSVKTRLNEMKNIELKDLVKQKIVRGLIETKGQSIGN